MGLNLLFVGVLLALHFKGPHAGLALASAVAAYINAALLYRGLRHHGVYHPAHGWSRVLFAVLAGVAAMAAWLLWRYGSTESWLEAGAQVRVRMLADLVISGSLVYLVVMFGSGLRKHHLEKGAL
jgi:putative peptidoglycan lipid II flippase